MLAGLQWLLKYSPIGLSIRAVSNNSLGAKYCGINTDRTIVFTFIIGSSMGALAGILVGLYYGAIFPSMGFTPGIQGLRRHGDGWPQLHSGRGDLGHRPWPCREHLDKLCLLGLGPTWLPMPSFWQR